MYTPHTYTPGESVIDPTRSCVTYSYCSQRTFYRTSIATGELVDFGVLFQLMDRRRCSVRLCPSFAIPFLTARMDQSFLKIEWQDYTWHVSRELLLRRRALMGLTCSPAMRLMCGDWWVWSWFHGRTPVCCLAGDKKLCGFCFNITNLLTAASQESVIGSCKAVLNIRSQTAGCVGPINAIYEPPSASDTLLLYKKSTILLVRTGRRVYASDRSAYTAMWMVREGWGSLQKSPSPTKKHLTTTQRQHNA